MGTRRLLALVAAVGLAATGCAMRNAQTPTTDYEREMSQKNQEISQLESSMKEMERDLERERKEAKAAAEATARAERAAEEARVAARAAAEGSRSTRTGQQPASSSYTASAGGNLFPPDARPGECYARVIIPAEYNTSTERLLKRQASEKIEVFPAEYEWAQEKVLVKPEGTKLIQVPATYKTVTEKVLVSPARTVWKKGAGAGSASAGSGTGDGTSAAQVVQRWKGKVVETRVDDTGEIMCLVEEPAKYKTLTKQVVNTPATTKTVTVPAEYETVKVQREVRPAREKRIAIPEEYATLTKTEKVSDERLEWRPVLCKVNMTTSNVRALQTELKQDGCYECTVDGIMGPCTYRATQCYAKRHNLPSGTNYVTLQVVEKLGLRY